MGEGVLQYPSPRINKQHNKKFRVFTIANVVSQPMDETGTNPFTGPLPTKGHNCNSFFSLKAKEIELKLI